MTARSGSRSVLAGLLFVAVAAGSRPAQAQGRDSLLNGAVIGAAVGAGMGVTLAYALRDTEVTAEQYAYTALVYGGLGAAIGLGVDALLQRMPAVPATGGRLLVAPALSRRATGVVAAWRWQPARRRAPGAGRGAV